MSKLAELRAKLAAKSNNGQNYQASENVFYPIGKIPTNTTAILRFLPDKDTKNVFFWVDKLTIYLPFDGVKGQHDKPVTVAVPCVEMYGKTCPIITETKPWWKDESTTELARKYYKKKSHIYQGFVVESKLTEENPPENPIRKFTINPSVHKLIKDSLMDPELDHIPTDFDNGLDFRLNKGEKGQYADYSASSWSRKTRALTELEKSALNQYGLWDLKTLLPKEPSDKEIEVIFEMFKESVDGAAYDPAKFSNYYKPYGLNNDDNEDFGKAESNQNFMKAAKEEIVEQKESVSTPSEQPAKKDPAAILAMLRAKSAQNN